MSDQEASNHLQLTTSERHARLLSQQFGQRCREQGQQAWQSPPIYSINAWVRDQWLSLWPQTQLIHPVHELALYLEAVNTSEWAETMVAPVNVARAAAHAAGLAEEYGIDVASVRPESDEQAAFKDWHARVRQRMQQAGWVTAADVFGELITKAGQGEWTAPEALVLQSASGLNPLQQGLIDHLAESGTDVQYPEVKDSAPAQPDCRIYADTETELRAVVAGLAQRLADMDSDSGQSPLIILAVPALNEIRPLLDTVLGEYLLASPAMDDMSVERQPWRYSRGEGLDQQPLVAAAMDVLMLNGSGNSLQKTSRVLLSRSLWSESERSALHGLDYALRSKPARGYALGWLAQRDELAGCAAADKLLALNELLQSQSGLALPSAWAGHFRERLQSIDWPGADLDSVSHQAVEAFEESLNELAAMDRALSDCRVSEALKWLNLIVSRRPFQPGVDHQQPILICEYDEAADLPADAIYVLQASDQRLPLPRITTAFLPPSVLKDAGVATTAELAIQQSREWIDRLTQQTSALFFSCPIMDDSGAELLPTPMLDWSADVITEVTDSPVSALLRTTSALQYPEVDEVPAVTGSELPRGGSGLLKDYAEAPFFAFCKGRLGLEAFPDTVSGLDAMTQGNVMHEVLALCWQQLKNSEALNTLSEQALTDLAQDATRSVCDRHLAEWRLGPALVNLEQGRIADVAVQWLMHERRRVRPFEVVAHEQKMEAVISGLPMRLRIDRIDRLLVDGQDKYLILDYKTGRSTPAASKWYPPNIEEPQLPLYAVLADLSGHGIEQVDGIAYAHVHDGHPALTLYSNFAKYLIDDEGASKQDWPDLLARWQQALADMAEGIMTGDARIDINRDYSRSFSAYLTALVRYPDEAPS